MNIGAFCGAIGFGGSQNTTVSLAAEFQRLGQQVILYLDAKRFRSHKDIRSFTMRDLPLNAWWS